MMLRALSLLTLLAIGAGCGVNVDEQTLHLRYDAEHDRLNMLLVSRGLFETGTLFQKGAEEWIDAVTRGDRCVVVTFIPAPMNLDGPTTTPEDEEFARIPLVRAMSVQHGDLFLDDRGRPSMWQCLRIDHLTSVLEDLNRRLGERLRDAKQRVSERAAPEIFPDDGTLSLWQSTRRDFAFFSLRGNALVLRLPLSQLGHRHVLEQLLGDPTESSQDPQAARGRWLADCLRREWSLVRTGAITELVVGNPESREQVFDLPAGGTYYPNLLAKLEARHIPVAPSLDEARMLHAFDEFCAR